MSKPTTRKVDPRHQALRDLVARDNKGHFGKGNKNAAGRRTATAEKSGMLRDTPVNCTTEEMSRKFWLTMYVMAIGDLKNGTLPVEWCAKIVADKLYGNRHSIANDERMLKLEAELERIYLERPELRPTLAEQSAPMKLAVTTGA